MVFRSGFEQGIAWCRKVGVGDGKRVAGFAGEHSRPITAMAVYINSVFFMLQSLCNGAGNAAKSKYKLICTIDVVQCGVLDLGFRDVKAQLLACMKDGAVSHVQRSSIDVKNLLATGQVTLDEVSEVIRAARGNHYRCSPHHVVDGIDVHIITINRGGTSWYIKWYFLEPQSIFISVHH